MAFARPGDGKTSDIAKLVNGERDVATCHPTGKAAIRQIA